MRNTITITNKGQTTLPVAMRRKLGITGTGGVLQVRLNERKGEIIISKAINAEQLSARLSSYIKPNTKPLKDVDEYYQANKKIKES